MASHVDEGSGTTMDTQSDTSGEGIVGTLLAKSGNILSAEMGKAAMAAVPSSVAPPANQVVTAVSLQPSAAEPSNMDLDDDVLTPGQVSRNDEVNMHTDIDLDCN